MSEVISRDRLGVFFLKRPCSISAALYSPQLPLEICLYCLAPDKTAIADTGTNYPRIEPSHAFLRRSPVCLHVPLIFEKFLFGCRYFAFDVLRPVKVRSEGHT